MATTYFAWTFPVERRDVRADFRGLDDVSPLMKARGEAAAPLMCASRNDWVADVLLNRITPTLGVFSLNFVRNTITVLDSSAIADAISDINRLLTLASSNPSLFGRTIGYEDAAAITDALQQSEPAADPIYGPAGEDDGDGPVYLFAYLKSLLKIFLHAQLHSLAIIHVRHEHEPNSSAA